MVLVIIICYFILMIGIGIYSHFHIHTPDDYYIGGKRGSSLQISGSLLATILGGSAILGTVELAQNQGWAAIWFLLSASLGLFVLAPIAKYVSRYGHYTLPELLESFFGKQAKVVSSVIISIAWIGVVAAQIIGGATILSGIHLMDYKFAALVSGFIFIVYTLIGGQKSILKTDFFQSIFIIVGIVLLFLLVFNNIEKNTIDLSNSGALFNSKFGLLDLMVLLLTYSMTFVVGPDIYSRIFCARNEKTAVKSVLTVALILIPIAFILTYLGVTSTTLPNPETTNNGLIMLGEYYLPEWAFAIMVAALLSAVMSSADTTLLTASMILSGLINKNLDEKKAMYTTRFLIFIIGVVSILISLYITSIIQMLLLALAFFSGAFIVPTIAGVANWKINKANVIYAMICGGIVALAGKLINNFIDALIGNFIVVAAYGINIIILRFGNR